MDDGQRSWFEEQAARASSGEEPAELDRRSACMGE
jgi:hypothetical protein